MTTTGRPLWALLMLLLLWAGVRAVAYNPAWNWAMATAYAEPIRSPIVTHAHDGSPPRPNPRLFAAGVRLSLPPSTHAVTPRANPIAAVPPPTRTYVFALPASPQGDPPTSLPPALPGALPPPQPAPAMAAAAPSRWSLDGWVLWRRGSSAAALARSGQLGGAQAGLRVAYDLTPSDPARLALYGRLTGALRDPVAPEAAIGLGLQPSRALPVTVGIERRIALGNGGRDAFALLAAGGFGPLPLGRGLWAEGYGQAGMVGFRSRDAFADGRLSLLHDLDGGRRFAFGAAISGGAQPGVARLDIGPAAQARFAVAGRPFRLTAEWRQRVAGRARPGSGPAVTLATSF